jgi:hypothetical protein
MSLKASRPLGWAFRASNPHDKVDDDAEGATQAESQSHDDGIETRPVSKPATNACQDKLIAAAVQIG